MEFGPGIQDAEALVDADLKSISSRFKGVNVPTQPVSEVWPLNDNRSIQRYTARILVPNSLFS